MEVADELLARLPFLAGLSPERRRDLLSRAQTRHLKPRDTLFHQGDTGDALFLIRSGLLKVYAVTESGREKVLRLLGPGDAVGELGLLEAPERSASVVALQPSVLLRLPRQPLLAALQAEPEAGLELCAALARYIRTLTEEIEDATFLDLPARLAKALVTLGERIGRRQRDGTVTIELAMTQQELATLVGSSRARVSEHLNRFADRGLIHHDRGTIVIPNPDRLLRETT